MTFWVITVALLSCVNCYAIVARSELFCY